MSRRFTKIICAILSAVVALGILLTAGCSKGHTDTPLSGNDIFTGEVKSNGGFAVEKGSYIYFINGIQSSSASNDYGKPVRGAISRISKTDYAAHNYSNTQIVVPQIVYSANHNAGIFIYGDEVYYGTPSTAKNADGVVQYQNLEMQSTKLDRSRTSAPYISFSDSSCEYRYVEVEGTVYLLYVATGETLYDESTGVTNIHSLNTKTGKNTLLAYNVASYIFDDENKTNERIYYTMNVKNYASGSNYGYNQVYTVTADVTEANEYDTSALKGKGWDDDKDHYINCGQLVFEGRGGKVDKTTPFNYDYPNEDSKNVRNYTYTLKTYLNGTLVFTRNSTDITEQYLYTYKDGAIDSSDPIALNTQLENKELLKNGSSADTFKYIFKDNGDIKAVIKTESSGGISINYVVDGKLHEKKFDGENLEDSKYFNIVKDGTATILFLDRDSNFLYYSLSGNGTNGNSIFRVDYSSENYSDYAVYEFDPTPYTPVRILDLDAATDWYLPELIEGQLIYATAASDMTLYPYILACDLRNSEGKPMSNAEIRSLNELYESITKKIDEYGDSEKYPTDKYQNITNILKYAFYSADTTYVYKHQKKVNDAAPDKEKLPFSDESLAEYEAFLKPAEDNNWKDFTASKTVNGNTVYATYRSYYYSLLGNMSSSDKEAYANSLVTSYLPSYTEETYTWWESIGTVGRVFFIIGMCVIGLLVIDGIIVLVVFLVQRKKRATAPAKRRRIRVDTTDDKSIDVYNN